MLVKSSMRRIASNKNGFALVELMIAVTLSLMMIGGLIQFIAATSRSHASLAEANQQLDSGRYAIKFLQEELQHAGYYGIYHGDLAAPGTLPDPCSTSVANVSAAIALPIQGYNNPASSPLSCLPAANHIAGTDIIVVRRTATSTTAFGAMTIGEIYLQHAYANQIVDLGENAANFTLTKKNGVTPASANKLRVDIYFVSPCNRYSGFNTVCTFDADDGAPIPTLKRLELTTDGTATVLNLVPLVSGVENLQVDFGIDRNGDGTPSESNPGVSGDDFIAAPSGVNEWMDVVMARVYLLARSVDRRSDYTDNKIYNLGTLGSIGPFGDSMSRHVFTTSVRLVNVSARREIPS